jgi:hypothetical protein
MGTWNDDERHRTERVEFSPELRRDWNRQMQNQSLVVEPKHRHPNRDGDQARLRAELVSRYGRSASSPWAARA